jgi:threonyl-tRNA synthetase
MFPPMELDGADYPQQNCPFHILVYRSRVRTAALPLLLFQFGTVRNELSA